MTKKTKSQEPKPESIPFSATGSTATDILDTQITSTTIPDVRLDQLRDWFREALELPGFFNFRVEYPEGRFAYVSPSILRLLPKSGQTDPQRTLTLNELMALIESDDTAQLNDDLKKAETGLVNGKTIIERDLRMALQQEGELWMELTMVLQYDNNGQLQAIIGVLHDIQRHKDREQELMDEADEVKSFSNNLPTGSFRANVQGDVLYANRACLRMFGYDSLEEFRNVEPTGYYANTADFQRVLKHLESGRPLEEIVWRAVRKDKSEFWASSSGHVLYDDQGKVVSFEGNVRDITQDVDAARLLETRIRREQLVSECANILLNFEETDPLEAVLDRMLHGLNANIVGLFNNITDRSEGLARQLRFCKTHGGSSCQLFGEPGTVKFYPSKPEVWQKSLMRGEVALLNASRAVELNLFDINSSRGSVIVLVPLFIRREWYGFIAFLFENRLKIGDSILLSLTTLADLIGSYLVRKETDDDLLESINEKDLLLREINHRVKNNLALVSGLLDMQARRSESEEVKQILAFMRARIQALSEVHRQLYAHREMDRVDFGKYLETISEQIVQSFTLNRERIQLEVACQPITLDLDHVMYGALVATELITNSLKHAFPDGRKGKLKIGLYRDEKGLIVLDIADNGVGFTENDEDSTGSLGTQLVEMLADQLGGTLERIVDHGTVVRLRFPIA